jgi:hypothetical protein
MRDIRDRGKDAVGEGRRRFTDTRQALTGRRRNVMRPVLVATAIGVAAGAAAVTGMHRLVQALPRTAQRQLAVVRARARRDRVAALVESNRRSSAPPPVPLFKDEVK